jgi:hypothetical protein
MISGSKPNFSRSINYRRLDVAQPYETKESIQPK